MFNSKFRIQQKIVEKGQIDTP